MRRQQQAEQTRLSLHSRSAAHLLNKVVRVREITDAQVLRLAPVVCPRSGNDLQGVGGSGACSRLSTPWQLAAAVKPPRPAWQPTRLVALPDEPLGQELPEVAEAHNAWSRRTA